MARKRKGAAWGAQSPTTKRAKKKQDAAEGYAGDFGKYMANKVRKLGEQFNADASSKIHSDAVTGQSSEVTHPRIFEGISIHVNGYTTPSHQDLRTLMLRYGGHFENYFSKSRVTHIICSNLPESKIKDFRSFCKGLSVIKPEWIVESIESGKLLPWANYQLELNTNQRRLSSFFGSKKVHFAEDQSGVSSGQTSENAQTTLAPEKDIAIESENTEAESSSVEVHVEEDQSDTIKDEENEDEPLDQSRIKHSTLGDPNFVKNYFKSSRLHFIGTWRNRYQQEARKLQQAAGKAKLETDQQAIIHVDMDCFFVSVVTRNRPELEGKPVAVCHSDSSKGTAEISSANYEARKYGIKAGMFVRNAKTYCPGLEIVPYDFEAYEQVAEKLYDILHRHSPLVQAVSCDEAYIDVTGMEDPMEIATQIRREIYESTRCTASAGVSGNILLARLATKKAKPNGLYQIQADQGQQFMSDLPVEDLPGVGFALQQKLHSQKLFTCSDICSWSKDALRKVFGFKTGEMLFNYARGIDDRKVEPAKERKSIGAEVNWGVRFSTPADAQNFLVTLAEEVSTRLSKVEVQGRTFTMKVKKRKSGAGEPVKYMGCGECDNISRSATVPSATNNRDVILRIARQLFGALNLDVREVRGVGLQVTRLEPSSNENSGIAQGQKRLEFFINNSPQKNQHVADKPDVQGSKLLNPNHNEGPQILPPASEIDPAVLASLPRELFNELNQAYNGALSNLNREDVATSSHQKTENIGEASPQQHRKLEEPSLLNQHRELEGEYSLPTFSQIDKSVLSELPTQMQKEIIEHIPPSKPSGNKCKETGLWSGEPPFWVSQFQEDGSDTLRVICDIYTHLNNPRYFSQVLMDLNMSIIKDEIKGLFMVSEEYSISKYSELIREYIQATVSTDLEEIYTLTRLIKRMANKWCFWNEVLNRVLPLAQNHVLHIYNGYLKI